MKKTVSFTREAALVGSEPKDSWEVLNCSPAEAVDMAMRLLGQVTRVLQTVNEQQIQEQQQIIKGLAETVPGSREYIDTMEQYMKTKH